jgi:hypothetical protein
VVQLSRPHALWARRWYDADKLERARERYAPSGRLARLGTSISNLVAGAPSDETGPE